MIAENSGQGATSTDLPLRLVKEVSQSLAHAEVSELPQVLCRIVEAAGRLFPELRDGAISLLDYVFAEQYLLDLQGKTPSPVRRQKFSEQAPDITKTSGSEVSLVTESDGSNLLIRVPVVVRSQDVALLSLVSRTQTFELSTDTTCALETLASLAAVAIDRRWHREQTQQGLLVHANAIMVGQIATSFLHEAKNSLNGMSLAVHNLIHDIGAEPNLRMKKAHLERLETVLTEMQRLDNLSRRLQRFNQQGFQPQKRESFLNDIVGSTIQLLEAVLREKQMRFEVRLDSRLAKPKGSGKGNPLLLDESQIQQALMNLVLNAVSASPERSPLQIETRYQEGCAEIRIRDFGKGISPDNKQYLFTPFFTTRKDGAGLGLYITRLMIEKNHNGKIEIEDTSPGRGTTFLVRLPRQS